MKDNFTGSGDGFLGVFDEKLRFGEFEREDLLSRQIAKVRSLLLVSNTIVERFRCNRRNPDAAVSGRSIGLQSFGSIDNFSEIEFHID